MAPPKTYRKMRRNMAPWIVPSTTSWGLRRNLRIVRRAMTPVLVRSDGAAARGCRGAGGDGPAVVDDDDVAGQVVGLVEVLRGEQDVGAPLDEGPDGAPQLVAAAGVEAG